MAAALPRELTDLERSVLAQMLDRPGESVALIAAQLSHAIVSNREHTGVGFYTNFAIPDDAPILRDLPDHEIGDVGGKHPQLRFGAGFLLFIRNGVVSFLEGYTYEDPWPSDESSFTIH